MRMRGSCIMACLSVVVILTVASFAVAAPSLLISKPPVTPVPSWTGPMIDPDAVQGQWFLDRATGIEEVREYEFHDNVIGFGGGFASSQAIMGIPSNVLINGQGNIVSFDIIATITNDTPGQGSWLEQPNSHGESRLGMMTEPYVGTLYDTKLTAEFAVEALSYGSWLAGTGGTSLIDTPYSTVDPLIYAVNPDELGWYCWTPNNPTQQIPAGGYVVPTYDFGDIALGQSVTKTLSFTVGGTGLPTTDPRFVALTTGQDIFLNRTTSLKISDWIESIYMDNGMPYPGDEGIPWLNSDVSVFHTVPEPGTMLLLSSMLALGLLFGLRRRK